MENNKPQLKKVEGKIDEWKAELAKLKAQAKQASGEVEAKFQKAAHDLENKISEADKKLQVLGAKTAEKVEEGKNRASEAWNELTK